MRFFRRHRANIIALGLGAGLYLFYSQGRESIGLLLTLTLGFLIINMVRERMNKVARWKAIDDIRHPWSSERDKRWTPVPRIVWRSIVGRKYRPVGSRTEYGSPWHEKAKDDNMEFEWEETDESYPNMEPDMEKYLKAHPHKNPEEPFEDFPGSPDDELLRRRMRIKKEDLKKEDE